MAQTGDEWKAEGNKHLKAEEYEQAIECYNKVWIKPSNYYFMALRNWTTQISNLTFINNLGNWVRWNQSCVLFKQISGLFKFRMCIWSFNRWWKSDWDQSRLA